MIVNRTHLGWAFLVTVLTGVFAVLYFANFHPEMLPVPVPLPEKIFGRVPPARATVGGTPLGLFFGGFALAIFLFASALGIRKKRRTWPLGNVQWWLKAHIWLTILTIPLVLFHCGGELGGPMTTWVIIFYAIVMVSGFFGLALQQYMPTLMTQRLNREVVYEQIPYVREVLVRKADELWAELAPVAQRPAGALALAGVGGGHSPIKKKDEPSIFGAEIDDSPDVIATFLHDDAFPFLRAKRADGHRLSNPKVADDIFRLLRVNVTERWRDRVDEIQQWCDDRRNLDVQTRLHHWLHGWLLIHVPFSFALLVLTIWHAYVTLIYL